jgi:hypothetical protein
MNKKIYKFNGYIFFLLIFLIILLLVIIKYFNYNNIELFDNNFTLDNNNNVTLDDNNNNVTLDDNNNFILDDNGKFKIYDECKFSGEGFNEDHEIGECSVAIQIIPLCNNVLEIGGGAGKVSHMINSVLAKRNLETQHIVVEPGSDGFGHHGDEKIYINKNNFNDKYTIVKKLCNDLTFDDIKILDNPPDCLYTDCEGCLKDCQETPFFKYVLDNVRFIINEMDGFIQSNEHDDHIRNIWILHGFKKIGVGYGCGLSCNTEIWSK